MVKNLPAMRETWVLAPGQKDPLEKEMATHSSILVWRIPWTKEPGGLQSVGVSKSRTQASPWRLGITVIHPSMPLFSELYIKFLQVFP